MNVNENNQLVKGKSIEQSPIKILQNDRKNSKTKKIETDIVIVMDMGMIKNCNSSNKKKTSPIKS